MKIQYQDFNFRQATRSIINYANTIIDEYLTEGYELTLRQLYYQFVARGVIANKDSEYKRLGSIVNDGRLSGLINWDAIVDRTRKVEINNHWDSPSDIIQSAANDYAIDTRKTQEVYVEVWIEKEALAGILDRACEPLDVPYFSCRGYVSQSAMWRASRRIQRKLAADETAHKSAVILHFGDHDPSGIDMTRDIADRLEMFKTSTKVKRVALNMDQVRQYNPPPNPAKLTDSRCQGYISEYGNESWELDALDPRTMTTLIKNNVTALTNQRERKTLVKLQENQRESLQEIADNYDDLTF